MEGGFVVRKTKRKGSAVPMDQALEQYYNKPAKGAGGIIGNTRKKEAVALHDLIKQEKQLFISHLENDSHRSSEYSIHHEFSKHSAVESAKDVNNITKYIETLGSTLTKDFFGKPFQNLVTGEINDIMFQHNLSCITKGSSLFNTLKKDRMDTKKVLLTDPIKKFMPPKEAKPTERKIYDIQKETLLALQYIEYAQCRESQDKTVLAHELTPKPFFLVDREGLLRKSDKYLLQKTLIQYLDKDITSGYPSSDCLMIDFMANVYTVTAERLQMQETEVTFGHVANLLLKFSKLGATSKSIHILFDIYKDSSIKNTKRSRRSGKKSAVNVTITNEHQKFPIDLSRFWCSKSNKTNFQHFFIHWVMQNYHGEMDVFLGGGLKDKIGVCILVNGSTTVKVPELQSFQEEADDRIMFHISYAVDRGAETILVATKDTDIFICLLYHLTKWTAAGLKELWFLKGSSKNKQAIPLHQLYGSLPMSLVVVLPALHSLTGCDTTSKIATKPAAIKRCLYFEDIQDFGKDRLDTDMLFKAENFLTHCLKENTTCSTFDELRLEEYYKYGRKVDFSKLPCTSESIHLHVQRSYLQCKIWLDAPHGVNLLTPLDYGYSETDSGQVTPGYTYA